MRIATHSGTFHVCSQLAPGLLALHQTDNAATYNRPTRPLLCIWCDNCPNSRAQVWHCLAGLQEVATSSTDHRFTDLIRTRDAAKLDESDIVLDVGGIYDSSKHRYDHHQRGFEEVFSPVHTTKLSSAGLVYKHFGKQLIAQALQEKGESDEQKVEILYRKLYENFVEALDGIDNGIQQYEGDSKPRYSSRTDLSSRVAHVSGHRDEP